MDADNDNNVAIDNNDNWCKEMYLPDMNQVT
jgi:hypothetical protein